MLIMDMRTYGRINNLILAGTVHVINWCDNIVLSQMYSDLTALETYCSRQFISLVPYQDSLGHFEEW